MRSNGIMANLRVADIAAAKTFYTDFLGLSTEVFSPGWVARYTWTETGAKVQLVTRDATASEDSIVSVYTDDSNPPGTEAQGWASRSCVR
jgi:catechol 2,3-dioxygenase-like lactoylglutathione lyase family enzyme